MKKSLLLLALGLTVSGCADQKFVGRPDLRVVGPGELPPPLAASIVNAERPYAIGPADKLAIDVFGVPEATREVTVDPTGFISIPLAGHIHAAGLTPIQLTELVTQRLQNNFVRNPRVTVNVVEIVSQTFTVDGQVATPGIFPFGTRMTLLRAIARAEGTTEFAKENYVVVYRTVNETRMAALYDLRAVRAGMFEDPQIFPDDVIVVGESRARRVFKDVLAASGLITTPLIAIIR